MAHRKSGGGQRVALWDLKGKLLGVPLYKLLGGKQQERLPVCASSHPRAHTIEGMAQELADHITSGYQLVKVGFGKKGLANLGQEEARDIAFVHAVREAIAYCESNPSELAQDYARDEALMEATGMNDPDYKYHPQPKVLTPQERARINRL